MAFTFINIGTFDSSSATSVVIPKPTNTAENDIMFAVVNRADSQTFTVVPTGWTSIALSNLLGFSVDWQLFYKVAGASEPSDYTWTKSGIGKSRGIIVTYRGGFDITDPIDVVSNTEYETSDTTCRAVSMNVSNNNSPLLFFGIAFGTSPITFTKPSVPTTDWVEDNDAGTTNSDMWYTVDSMVWSSSGATGNMDSTLSTTLTEKHAFAVALNVSVVEPTVTTQAVSNKATTSGLGNGNITDTGGANATRRGFCYMTGTSGDPTTANSTVYDDGDFGTGAYTKSITGLTAGTAYRVRAYAVNSAGTSYGTTVDYKTTFDKVITETAVLTSSFIKVPSRILSQTIILTDSLLKLVNKVYSETLILTDSIIKILTATRIFTETITIADTFIKTLSKIMLESLIITGNFIKNSTRIFSENAIISDVLTSLRVIPKIITETITIADIALSKLIQRVYTETVVLTASFLRVVNKIYNEIVILTDILTASLLYIREFLEAISLTDIINKVEQRAFTENAIFEDIITSLRTRMTTLSDSVVLTDTFFRVIYKVLSEVVVITDTLIRGFVVGAWTETLVLTASFLSLSQKVFTETVILTDSIIRVIGKVLTETVSLFVEIIISFNGIVTNLWSKVSRTLDSWTKTPRN